MNSTNIRRVRDAIAAAPEEMVDMRRPGAPGCGSPGCILGWGKSVLGCSEWWEAIGGMTDYFLLITPPNYDYPGAYTKADVVETLDRLLETGEVKWPAACPRVK